MGGGCGRGFGLAASCAAKKEKLQLRSWTVAGPGTERGGFRESPYETVGKVGIFPAQAGMSPPQCLNESPSKKEGKSDSASCSPRVARCLNESPSQ